MSELVRMCECGGRTLLDDEVMCPSCQRTHKSIGRQLQEAKAKVELAGGAAGQVGAALIGKLAEQARAGAHAAEQVAAPVFRSGVQLARTRGAEALKAAVGHAEKGGERALRAAIPLADRLLQRAKARLDKKLR